MNSPSPDPVRRWLGLSGVAFVGLNVLFLVMVFSVGDHPPALDDPALVSYLHDHSTRLATVTLISYLSLAPLFVFVAALRSLIRRTARTEWLADVVFAMGVIVAAIAFIDFGILGTALANATGNADPATVRTLEELGRYLGNLPSSLEWGMFMVAASLALWRTGILPRWVAWIGWIGAAIILATAGSLYVGDTDSFVAADNGIALLGLLALFVWMICVCIAALRPPAEAGNASEADQPLDVAGVRR